MDNGELAALIDYLHVGLPCLIFDKKMCRQLLPMYRSPMQMFRTDFDFSPRAENSRASQSIVNVTESGVINILVSESRDSYG